VKASIDRIVADAKALSAIGIGTIAIMSGDTTAYWEDSFGNMQLFAVIHGFTFPYVIDETQAVARAYGAQCTPEFFGFNGQDELQYRGRLDALGPNGRRELFEAMKQVAETGHGPREQFPPIGCPIRWKNWTAVDCYLISANELWRHRTSLDNHNTSWSKSARNYARCPLPMTLTVKPWSKVLFCDFDPGFGSFVDP
jgi:hypothetical protein